MKTVERILIKVAIIQFVFLLLSQVMLHQWGNFQQLKEITKYEGVNKNVYTEILETFSGK